MSEPNHEAANRIRDARSGVLIAKRVLKGLDETLDFAAERLVEALQALGADLAAGATDMQSEKAEVAEETEVPICPVHHQPMKWMETKKGNFWSCHAKDASGKFCTYRPAKQDRQ